MLRATTGRPRSHVVIAAVVGIVSLVVLAKIAARFYYDPALWAVAGWWVPPDGYIFIEAGRQILAGRSPYLDVSTLGDDVANYGYVYPPLLAIAVSPLSLVSGPTAGMLLSVALVVCVVVALWLLGVTDWRCYLVALLWPFNRVALDWGRIDPLLVLLIAATWRLRDRPWPAATSTGAAVATKLFLWPVSFWLLVTGRRRAAALSVVLALGLILLPWAALGFVDLLQYPELLRDVSRQEYDSFSATALVHATGINGTLTKAIVLGIGASLLALAVRCARNTEWSRRERDRRSLTLVLAASLVLSPVVWSNYFVLLLIPVALAYPTLSAPWLVVLAASLFDLFHDVSPDNRLQLVVVTVFVTAVFVAAYGPDRPRFLGAKPTRRRSTLGYDTARG